MDTQTIKCPCCGEIFDLIPRTKATDDPEPITVRWIKLENNSATAS